jgi:hypothetical protein
MPTAKRASFGDGIEGIGAVPSRLNDSAGMVKKIMFQSRESCQTGVAERKTSDRIRP